jgi:anti-anti-sigma regulatory factor
MTGLTTTVDHSPDTDITTIVVDGELDLATTTTVRAALLKALAECPVAVIVDMTRCHVITTAGLAVFPSVRRLYSWTFAPFPATVRSGSA